MIANKRIRHNLQTMLDTPTDLATDLEMLDDFLLDCSNDLKATTCQHKADDIWIDVNNALDIRNDISRQLRVTDRPTLTIHPLFG